MLSYDGDILFVKLCDADFAIFADACENNSERFNPTDSAAD